MPVPSNDSPTVPISGATRVVGLLGDPVSHSYSPLIHNTAFREHGLDFVYVPLRVRRDDVAAAVSGLRALRFVGANVTIPLKELVLPHLDDVSPQVQAIGAVNTITAHEQAGSIWLRGDNTDVTGFLAPLREMADPLVGCRCIVLGAGGAARAVTYALLSTFQPVSLTVAARNVKRAEKLVTKMRPFDTKNALDVRPLEDARALLRSALLIINTTPLGMHPNEKETPWQRDEDFDEHHIVYDLVYAPQETRLLKAAAARGAQTIGGLHMLVGQAAASFALWTGKTMPTKCVYRALAARISQS